MTLTTMTKKRDVVFALLLGVGGVCNQALHAQTELTLEKEPLFLSNSVPPNLVLTFDTGAAMALGFFPDTIGSLSARPVAKSVTVNALAYDPTVVYRPGLDGNGHPRPDADFFAAKLHLPTASSAGDTMADAYSAEQLTTVDLSSNFRFVWNPLLSGSVNSGVFIYAPETGDNAGGGGQPAYYYVRNNSNSGCDAKDKLDDDCYEKQVVTASEQQNFANWYQYHSLRYLKGKTVLTETIQSLPGDTRVAWQSTNSSNISSANNQTYVQSLDTPGVREALNAWLFTRVPQPSVGNPLGAAMVRTGKFFSSTADNNAYEQEPGGSGPDANEELACRSNYHLLFSGGTYAPDSSIALGDVDQQSVTLPDGKVYQADGAYSPIYAGAGSNTLADIAFYYWQNDLRSDLPNQVPPSLQTPEQGVANLTPEAYWQPANDVAVWQHVNQFVLGFGAGVYDPLSSSDFNALLSGASKWLSPFVGSVENQQNARVDDLWHAAINSRGRYFSALATDNSAASFASLSSVLEYRESAVARLSATSASLSSGEAVFQVGFDSRDWSGFLRRYPISTGQGAVSDECNSRPVGVLCALNAEVKSGSVLAWSQRKVFTLNPEQTTVGKKGVALTGGASQHWNELSASQQQDAVSQEQLDYMLGDDSHEQQQGGNFRNRSVKQRTLAAVVHAPPLWVSNGQTADGSYVRLYPSSLSSSNKSHEDFLQSIEQRPAMVYVSASDGLLHAYQYSTSSGTFTEKFVYLPDAILPQLAAFSSPFYAYKGLIDGDLNSGDVFYNEAWHSVLVGAFRQGAKGLFALDITAPDTFDQRDVLWEYTPRTTNNDDIGHVYGAVSVVKTQANHGTETQAWAVVTGNGYNSIKGNAVLLVIDMKSGETLASIDTGVGLNAKAVPIGAKQVANLANGLAAPFMVDINQDYIVDYAYAGDLYGNLWRFDLTSNDVNQWSATLIFTSAEGQAITAQAVVNRHSSKSGVMVYVGTGKYLEASDDQVTSSDATQSIYAIWDRLENTPALILPKHLLKQHILAEQGSSQGTSARVVSQNAITYFSEQNLPVTPVTEGYLGWTLDLPKGERVIEAPMLRSGLLTVLTMSPATDPCMAGASSWLMALDASNGGRLSFQAFDRDGDGLINVHDLITHDNEQLSTSGWQDNSLGLLSAPVVQHDRNSNMDHISVSSSRGNVSTLKMQTPQGAVGLKAWRRLR